MPSVNRAGFVRYESRYPKTDRPFAAPRIIHDGNKQNPPRKPIHDLTTPEPANPRKPTPVGRASTITAVATTVGTENAFILSDPMVKPAEKIAVLIRRGFTKEAATKLAHRLTDFEAIQAEKDERAAKRKAAKKDEAARKRAARLTSLIAQHDENFPSPNPQK